LITPRLRFPQRRSVCSLLLLCFSGALASSPLFADAFAFSTGNPDGLIATLSRTAAGGQSETADDFILGQTTQIKSARFIGLIPLGASLSSISQVEIEFYHVFPGDSANPPSGRVPTRDNSPGDVEIASATRDSGDGSLSFTSTTLAPSFSVLNSVVNGVNPIPNEFTGGEGPVTGQEVAIDVTFTSPVTLPGDHYFFRPEALLSDGNFLFLSAAKPIVAPGTPFAPDLQTWIRNDNLAPDWLRIGTDITHQGPFNASFSLAGNTVPEPGSLALFGVALSGLLTFGALRRRSHR
jgi:PEP-CTERM motif